jgi:nucleotide-binding universal stress UspA family protein
MIDATKPISSDSTTEVAMPFKNILAAADGSYTGTQAVQVGARLAEMCHAKLAVLHVVDTFAGFAPQFAWGPRSYETEYLTHGRAMLEALVKDVPGALGATPLLRAGDPSLEIVRAVNELGIDLLVVGGPSHHRLGRLLVGSVNEALLDQVHCAILVIPPDVVPKNKSKQPSEPTDDYD